jgi:RimJ/RimL family protein N-acetyltransferase
LDKFNAQDITYIPIVPDKDQMAPYLQNDFCRFVFDTYVDFYKKVEVHPPWTGYFALQDQTVLGVGGFKGNPVNGQIEIAYGTVPEFEGRGVSSLTCKFLTELAIREDSDLKLTARTLREKNASTSILKKNGYVFAGEVEDPEDGLVWDWLYDF